MDETSNNSNVHAFQSELHVYHIVFDPPTAIPIMFDLAPLQQTFTAFLRHGEAHVQKEKF